MSSRKVKRFPDQELNEYICRVARNIKNLAKHYTTPLINTATLDHVRNPVMDYNWYQREIFQLGEMIFQDLRTKYSETFDCDMCEYKTRGQFALQRMSMHKAFYHLNHVISQRDDKELRDLLKKVKSELPATITQDAEAVQLWQGSVRENIFNDSENTPRLHNEITRILLGVIRNTERPSYMHRRADRSWGNYKRYTHVLGEIFYSAIPKLYRDSLVGLKC